MVKIHEKFMARCLQLAENGKGTTYPNPMVGCVIVKNNSILSEGWHHRAGEAHAEAQAINNIDVKDLAGATLYVNLEPCNHVGRTAACAPLIVSSGIKKVVIGSLDTHHKVNGSGIEHLKKHGIEVVSNILTQQCRSLNKRFFMFHEQHRPYVVLKWAETKNGLVAPLAKNQLCPVWISNGYARQHTHVLRSNEHAILVGHRTWALDSPKLSAYRWNENNPQIVVLGGEKPKKQEVIWLSSEQYKTAEQVLAKLYELELQSVLVEGGPETLQRFIDANLWDECFVYKSQDHWNDGLLGPKLNKSLTPIATFQDNVLYHGKNQL